MHCGGNEHYRAQGRSHRGLPSYRLFLFSYTKLGYCLRAIGAGETTARFSGIRTNLTKFLVFVTAGAIIGFAAFLNVFKVGSIAAMAGYQLETMILTELFLGGMPISGGAKVRFSNTIIPRHI